MIPHYHIYFKKTKPSFILTDIKKVLAITRPKGFEPMTIGIGIRYSIRAELRADATYNSITQFCHFVNNKEQKFFVFIAVRG